MSDSHEESHIGLKYTKHSFFSSVTFRSFIIIALMLLMMVPLKLVQTFLDEKSAKDTIIIDEISNGWGEDQTIIGPILAVPYVEHITSVETVADNKGETRTISRDVFNNNVMLLLPEELRIDAILNERHRKRDGYDALVYKANLNLSGTFDLSPLPRENKKYTIHWKKSWLAVGLSDTKAINDSSPLRWENSTAKFEPGTRLVNIIPNGIHAKMKNTKKGVERPDFKIQLSINGKTKFRFAPLGESTVAKIESTWPTPRFAGAMLPRTKIISSDGFNAEWSIPYLSRSYPQSWILTEKNNYDLTETTTGVDLDTPSSSLLKVSKAIEYGAFFIGLMFLSFLIFEVTVKARIHIIQYIVIGLSLSIFYILLASLTAKLGFTMGYIYAASTVLVLITLYSAFILKSVSKTVFILILLGSLYLALYYIIQMESLSLLVGAGVLLFVMMLLMMASRHIDYDA